MNKIRKTLHTQFNRYLLAQISHKCHYTIPTHVCESFIDIIL